MKRIYIIEETLDINGDIEERKRFLPKETTIREAYKFFLDNYVNSEDCPLNVYMGIFANNTYYPAFMRIEGTLQP